MFGPEVQHFGQNSTTPLIHNVSQDLGRDLCLRVGRTKRGRVKKGRQRHSFMSMVINRNLIVNSPIVHSPPYHSPNRERGSAPKGGRHSTISVEPQ